MASRVRDWWLQAERDLEQAVASARQGYHEWACFSAHQSAEKAVKALHLALGQEARGHSIARLLAMLPPSLEVPPDLVEKARSLDAFYIPTRYPNAHSEGPPFEHYGPLQSEEALRYAREVLQFVRSALARPEAGGSGSAGLGP